MKTLQQIFDLMIQRKRYVAEDHSGYNNGIQSMFMCNALKDHSDDLITRPEARKAIKAIERYLRRDPNPDGTGDSYGTLLNAMCTSGLEFNCTTGLEIYGNWKRRPPIKRTR